MKTRKKAKSPATRTMTIWEDRMAAREAAMLRHHKLLQAAKEARVTALIAEKDLAVAGLAAVRAGYMEPANWLVWWWNNGDSSPRGSWPCVEHARDIPPDCFPEGK